MDAALDKAVDPNQLPGDVSLCHELIRQLLELLHSRDRQIGVLEHRLEALLRARFGPRAEKIDPAQLLLFAEQVLAEAASEEPESEEAELAESSPRRRKGHGRRRLPKDLPRKRKVVDVPPEERVCRCCGKEMSKIGEETSEKLDYIPASLYVLELVRPKYACRHCQEGGVVVADKPRQAIEKGLPGPGLLAQVITSKYCDHLPLYRQEQIFARFGVRIPRSTQCDWMRSAAELLAPLVEQMVQRVLSGGAIHTDDTPVPVLDSAKDRTRTGRLWAYVGDPLHPYTVYDYTPSRARDGPASFLADFEGYLHADAYGGYDGVYAGEKIIEVLCWAHARRKFFDAQGTDAERATMALAYIRRLYAVEREAKEIFDRQNVSQTSRPLSAIRLKLRQEKSVPVLRAFKQWLEDQTGGPNPVLPKSPMGQAVNYVLSNWEALERYVTHGKLDIDNNAAERAMRPVALGRKNWLFAGSDNGGKTAAVLYSLVAGAKRHGLDVFAYLRDVIARISDHPASKLEELLPDHWKLGAMPPAE